MHHVDKRNLKPGTVGTVTSNIISHQYNVYVSSYLIYLLQWMVRLDELNLTSQGQTKLLLPAPSLQFPFHIECDTERFRHIGGRGHGERSTVIFKDGRFEGLNFVAAYSEVAEIEKRFTTTMVFSKRLIWTQDATFLPRKESACS